MRVEDVAVARDAHAAAECRLASYAKAPGVGLRRGSGWVAVRTGAASNDLNGVVSEVGAPVSPEEVSALFAWFGSVPASWLTRGQDDRMTANLLRAGARSETTGRWSGSRTLHPVQGSLPGVSIIRVASVEDLDRWLEVAAACGWVADDQDRQARRRLLQAMGWDGALGHWLAVTNDGPVGFASSFLHGEVLDLCDLGVLASHRRRGIGRALVWARVAAASDRGVTRVVSAPSPEGWRLQQALGFASVAVIPDRCFYLPSR